MSVAVRSVAWPWRRGTKEPIGETHALLGRRRANCYLCVGNEHLFVAVTVA